MQKPKTGKKPTKPPSWSMNLPNTAYKLSEKRYNEKLKEKLFILFRTPSPYYNNEPLVDEELFKVITNKKNLALIRKACTHRYWSEDFHYEILEIRGDAGVADTLQNFLITYFPDEKRESTFSDIQSKFVGNEKSTEYSDNWALYEVIRKPEAFEITPSDREDVFEAFCGAIILIGDNLILTDEDGEQYNISIGNQLLQALLYPVFIEQGIDPAKAAEYKEKVTILSEACKTFFHSDAEYVIKEIVEPNAKGGTTTFYSAIVYKRVLSKSTSSDDLKQLSKYEERRNAMQKQELRGQQFKRVELARMDTPDEINVYGRSKKSAKERVAELALIKNNWTADYIFSVKEKNEKERTKKFSQEVVDNLIRTRKDALDLLFGPQKKPKEGKKIKKRSQEEEDAALEEAYGPAGVALQLPPQVSFKVKFIKNTNQFNIILYVFDRDIQEMRSVSAFTEKKSELNNAYRRLNKEYIASIRQKIGLPPLVV